MSDLLSTLLYAVHTMAWVIDLDKTMYAQADIRGESSAPGLQGRAEFEAHPNGTMVTVHAWGLPQTPTGFFALHIHEGESCSGEGFAHTGSHFNPETTPHPLHAGDLPPLLAADGNAYLSVLTNRFRVEDVVGRTVVIHSMPDDFHTQPAGAAGEKIACGIIRRR